MTAKLADLSNRSIEIEADNDLLPGSVFISGPEGACFELDRADFLAAIKSEFGLVDPLEAALLGQWGEA